MTVLSAGILLYRVAGPRGLEVWIVHMGGPFWARKDERAWSVPKGEYQAGENPFSAAKREFEEEVGVPAPEYAYAELGEFRQPSGKVITVFAAEADAAFRVDRVVSNTFPLEWPRGSGRVHDFPEIDDARWFTVTDARTKLVRGQIAVLDALEQWPRFGGRNAGGK